MTQPQEVWVWTRAGHTDTTSIRTHSLSSVLQMQGMEQPFRAPLTLFTLNTPEAIKDYAYGCDADVGRTSTVFFDFNDDPAHKPPAPGSDKNKNKLGAARISRTYESRRTYRLRRQPPRRLRRVSQQGALGASLNLPPLVVANQVGGVTMNAIA